MAFGRHRTPRPRKGRGTVGPTGGSEVVVPPGVMVVLAPAVVAMAVLQEVDEARVGRQGGAHPPVGRGAAVAGAAPARPMAAAKAR